MLLLTSFALYAYSFLISFATAISESIFTKRFYLKARSHDPILRIRFLVPKIRSRRSDGPISRFRFYGENVGRSFIVCSHDPIFRTNQESLIWSQNDHRDIMQTLAGAFHLSRRVSDKNRACSISIRFSKLRIRVSEGDFQYVHTFICSYVHMFGTNNNRILKNMSCEWAFMVILRVTSESEMFLFLDHKCIN